MAFCMLFAFGAFSASADEVVTEAPTTTNYEFVMNEGVSTKVEGFKDASVKNAIRFTTTLKKSDVESAMVNFDVKIKTIIVKAEELGSEVFTKENLDAKGINYQQVIFTEEIIEQDASHILKGENYVFNACLYNIQDENFTKEFKAISYIEINGEVTQYTAHIESGSLWDVADAHKTALETKYNGKDNVLVSEDKDEYEFVSSLCAKYDVIDAVSGNVVASVKHGETLASAFNDISASVNDYENYKFYKGTATVDGQSYNVNKAIVGDISLTLNFDELKFDTTGETAILTDGTAVANYVSKITVPSTINGKTVTTIGASAFANCENLTHVYLPDSVTKIESDAFSFCKYLVEVDLGGVTKLGRDENNVAMANAFLACNSLKVVIINKDLNVAHQTFVKGSWSNNIEGFELGFSVYAKQTGGVISIPTGVSGNDNSIWTSISKIYTYSANDCVDTWKYVDGEVKNSTVTEHSYMDGVCKNCNAVQQGIKYTLSSDGTYYSVTGYTGTDAKVYVRASIDNIPVTNVANNAFLNNTTVTHVYLPDNVTAIYANAFSGCANLKYIDLGGVSVIGASVTDWQVSENAFYKCNSLEYVVVKKDLSVPVNVFKPSGAEYSKFNVYSKVAGGTIDIYKTYNNSARNDLYSGKAYTYSEKDCVNTWKYDANGNIIISSVTDHIYDNGLCANCGADIATVGVTYTLSDDQTYYSVTGYTGKDAKVYVRASIDNIPVTTIGASAFTENQTITHIYLPNSVTVIKASAFQLCKSLEYIDLGGVSKLGGDSVGYGDAVNDAQTNAFLACNNLKYVVINKDLTVTRQTFIKGSHSTPNGLCIYAKQAGGTINIPTGASGNANTLWTENSKVYTYSETKPTENFGSYWHYVNGVPTVWTAEA